MCFSHMKRKDDISGRGKNEKFRIFTSPPKPNFKKQTLFVNSYYQHCSFEQKRKNLKLNINIQFKY